MKSLRPILLSRNPWRFLWLLMISSLAVAQSTFDDALSNYVRSQTQGLPGKVSYRITPLDPRTKLSPCDAYEPFIPSGSRLWGRATVGVRCLGPSNWTVYVQVQVNVSGNYLVSARPMPAGHVLNESDVAVRSGDLGALPTTILTDLSQAVGKTAKGGLSAGQVLRSDQLIAPWAVQQGQTVTTVANGPGFSVSSVGKALNNAVVGQVVQVRTDSGQVLSGIARSGGIVEMAR